MTQAVPAKDGKASRRYELDYRPMWLEHGWNPQPSELIKKVVHGSDAGWLSSTMRLVPGPGDQVAQVFFEPGDRPRVVALYLGMPT